MVYYPLYDGLDSLGIDRFGKLMDAFSPIAIFASKPSRQQRPNRLKPVAIQLNSSSGIIFIFIQLDLTLHYYTLPSVLSCLVLSCLLCSALLCSSEPLSTRLDPTRFDSTRFDPTRPGQTRPVSTRLDSTRLRVEFSFNFTINELGLRF